MPRSKSGSLPSYRLYKRTGQAVVTIDGRDHYLGEHGSPESYDHGHVPGTEQKTGGEPRDGHRPGPTR
jgi:hypothetical protein